MIIIQHVCPVHTQVVVVARPVAALRPHSAQMERRRRQAGDNLVLYVDRKAVVDHKAALLASAQAREVAERQRKWQGATEWGKPANGRALN